MMKTIAALLLLALTLSMPAASRAEHEGKIQILLLGDSATEASIPRKLAPQEPQFEDVIRILLAAEGDLPPTNVINLGLSGEFIRRLLDSGRYDKAVAKLPGLDYIFIRYGGNDVRQDRGLRPRTSRRTSTNSSPACARTIPPPCSSPRRTFPGAPISRPMPLGRSASTTSFARSPPRRSSPASTSTRAMPPSRPRARTCSTTAASRWRRFRRSFTRLPSPT